MSQRVATSPSTSAAIRSGACRSTTRSSRRRTVGRTAHTIRRSDDPDGYFGASHAKAALGSYWPETSPNRLVISVEVAGTAKEGPTEAQQRSMVALWDELKARYPRAVPLGHRDWQDVKPCPGRTAAMKAAFAAMGGHGRDHSEVRDMATRDYVSGRMCTVRDGSKLFDHPGGLPIGTVDPPTVRGYLGRDRSGDFALISSELDGKPRVRRRLAATTGAAAAAPAEVRVGGGWLTVQWTGDGRGPHPAQGAWR